MNILITGADGFIGKNLIAEINNIRDGKAQGFPLDPNIEVFRYDLETDPTLLDGFCQRADFVFNLAGVNRPKDEAEFMQGNFGFASTLLDTLKKYGNTCPVMISSSIQADIDNPYGRSKRAGEDLFFAYGQETGAQVLVYRFPNVFGKWCRPHYNSAVATFCSCIANNQPITISSRDNVVNLVYIDDVVRELINALSGCETRQGAFCAVPIAYSATLGQIVDLLYSFRASRNELTVPNMEDDLTRKLYATYLSYLPTDGFNYPLKMNIDERGSFTELIRTPDRGQFSVNISKPGILKGNHWHHSKNEKFIVVSGRGVIRFRKVGCSEVLEYFVSGDKLEVVDIPTGYTHNIENLGDADLVTFMWASEIFDKDKPDTYFEKV